MADQSVPQDGAAKAWSGRFSEPVSELVKRYTASVFFDNRMAAQDIRGSIAHATMLARQGIIGAQDLADIEIAAHGPDLHFAAAGDFAMHKGVKVLDGRPNGAWTDRDRYVADITALDGAPANAVARARGMRWR